MSGEKMIKLIIRCFSVFCILAGIYGFFACGLFYKNQIFSVSKDSTGMLTEARNEILERMEKMELEDLPETQKENIKLIVKQSVIDKYIMKEQMYKFHVVLSGLIASCFAFFLGLIGILFTKKERHNKTDFPDSATASPEI
jgi:ABC-type multidrug transport system permease subunit